jgi:hypothetical protein
LHQLQIRLLSHHPDDIAHVREQDDLIFDGFDCAHDRLSFSVKLASDRRVIPREPLMKNEPDEMSCERRTSAM